MTRGVRRMLAGALTTAAMTGAVGAAQAGAAPPQRQFLVVHRPTDTTVAARAVARTSGRIVRRIPRLGILVIRTRRPRARARLLRIPSVTDVVPDTSPARPPKQSVRTTRRGARALQTGSSGPDPLEPLQWNLQQVRAGEAADRQDIRPEVVVGVIDAGIDATHPDLRGVYDAAGSRSFTRDQAGDGACADEADGSCLDAPGTDDRGSGTHIASIVAAARDGAGIAGVAPGVRVASLRATQDRGELLLTPFLDALAHAANRDMDVVLVGQSITIPGDDCSAQPAALAARLAAKTAVQRAVDDARGRGVTIVSGLGNDGRPLGADGCAVLPAQARGVVAVSALGPDRLPAPYANTGLPWVSLAAPGGNQRAFADDPLHADLPENMVLGADPTGLAAGRGELDANGTPLTPAVLGTCIGSVCTYYRWREGSAIAAAHVAGTAALIISRYGFGAKAASDPLTPGAIAVRMERTAAPFACPDPADTPSAVLPPCSADSGQTTVAGFGILDAAASVGARAAQSAG
ncbi:MAG: S8 family serine peptidase [Thermoleophilia bacterium]